VPARLPTTGAGVEATSDDADQQDAAPDAICVVPGPARQGNGQRCAYGHGPSTGNKTWAGREFCSMLNDRGAGVGLELREVGTGD